MLAALALGQGLLDGPFEAPSAYHARARAGLVNGLRAPLEQVVASGLACGLALPSIAQSFRALHARNCHAIVLQLVVNRIRPLELLACIDVVRRLMGNSPRLLWLHRFCLIQRDRLSDSLAKHTAKRELVGASFLADLFQLVSARAIVLRCHEICVPLHLIDDLATVHLLDRVGVLESHLL